MMILDEGAIEESLTIRTAITCCRCHRTLEMAEQWPAKELLDDCTSQIRQDSNGVFSKSNAEEQKAAIEKIRKQRERMHLEMRQQAHRRIWARCIDGAYICAHCRAKELDPIDSE